MIPCRNLLFLVCLMLAGCATPPRNSERAFNFQTDSFSYANKLVWIYNFDPATGQRTVHRAEPAPDYTHHCFVVVRAAKQFFNHARFEAGQPKADDKTYRQLVRNIMARSPRRDSAESMRIVVPGYANLREFSRDWESLLKEECGGAWQSYFQRGHWRMMFPFRRAQQESVAEKLARNKSPQVLHLVRFPQLSINHAVLTFDSEETEDEIRFAVYDPNAPEQPTTLTYSRRDRTFYFPCNDYFIGGKVNVYPIYSGWLF